MHDVYVLSTKPRQPASGVELNICSVKANIVSYKYLIGPLSLLGVVGRCGEGG